MIRATVFVLSLGVAAAISPAAPASANASTATSVVAPGLFLDDTGTRVFTIEAQNEGRFTMSIFALGGGSYSRSIAVGEAAEKGIIFAQRSEEGDSGPQYLATGTQTKLLVKLKPGQANAQETGFSGSYHRMTEEKFSNVMKKDYEVTEKRLEACVRDLSKKLKADDKPGLLEWKKHWPEIRERVLSSKNSASQSKVAAPQPKTGFTNAVSQQKPASFWMNQAETIYGAINFITAGVPLGLPAGWEGRYEDGFGGVIDLETRKSGDLVIEMRSDRGVAANMPYDGRIPAASIKNSRDGKDDSAEFTDKNPDATKDGAPAMHVKLHRIGNFLVVETSEAQRYAGGGWFDGVFIKRARPDE